MLDAHRPQEVRIAWPSSILHDLECTAAYLTSRARSACIDDAAVSTRTTAPTAWACSGLRSRPPRQPRRRRGPGDWRGPPTLRLPLKHGTLRRSFARMTRLVLHYVEISYPSYALEDHPTRPIACRDRLRRTNPPAAGATAPSSGRGGILPANPTSAGARGSDHRPVAELPPGRRRRRGRLAWAATGVPWSLSCAPSVLLRSGLLRVPARFGRRLYSWRENCFRRLAPDVAKIAAECCIPAQPAARAARTARRNPAGSPAFPRQHNKELSP